MFVVDLRPLQDGANFSPLKNALVNLALLMENDRNTKFLIDKDGVNISHIFNNDNKIIYSIPNRRNSILYIGTKDSVDYFFRTLRPQYRAIFDFAIVEWMEDLCEDGAYVLKYKDVFSTINCKHNKNIISSDFSHIYNDLLLFYCNNFILIDGSISKDIDLLKRIVTLADIQNKIILAPIDENMYDFTNILRIPYDNDILNKAYGLAYCTLVAKGCEPEHVISSDVFLNDGILRKVSINGRETKIEDFDIVKHDFESYCDDIYNVLNLYNTNEHSISNIKPKIALITPMFPDVGGPPHSSLDLAVELTKLCDLDVWTNSPVLPEHECLFKNVFKLSRTFEAKVYDEIIYVFGNHKMYEPIFNMMLKYGGVVIQHDAHMVDFIVHRFGHNGLSSVLLKETGMNYPFENTSDIIKSLNIIGKPLLSPILERASSVIVHSPTSLKILNENYGFDVTYLPVGMPYSFQEGDITESARMDAKNRLGVDVSSPCIVSFGEVHVLKGAKQCLLSLYELKRFGVKFQFLFVGPILSELRSELEVLIENLGLVEFVKITDSVSEGDYFRYLQAGDIVLQIRQIPFGQLSGALLDAVSAGMYGVSSEGLAAAIEAPATIVRVADGASPFEYANKLRDLIESKFYKNRPGHGWSEFTYNHSFKLYAKKLLDVIFGYEEK